MDSPLKSAGGEDGAREGKKVVEGEIEKKMYHHP